MMHILKIKLLLLAIIALPALCISQDTLILNSNEIKIVKVTEINTYDVKYKLFNSEGNIILSEKKSAIKIIKYKNGFVESFANENISPENTNSPTSVSNANTAHFTLRGHHRYIYNNHVVSDKNMFKIMLQKNDPELNLILRKTHVVSKGRFISLAAIPVFVISILPPFASAWLFQQNLNSTNSSVIWYKSTGVYLTCASVGIAAIGTTFTFNYVKLKAKAVKYYNEKY